MATLIADTSLIKLYDLTSKYEESKDVKKILFCIILFISILLQIVILQFARTAIKTKSKIKIEPNTFIVQISYVIIIILVSLLVFQLFYLDYYNTFILILNVLTTYCTASYFIGKTAIMFLSWYRRSHDFIVLMYFVSMSLIVFNLLLTNIVVNAYLGYKPELIREFVGGSMDLSAGKTTFLVLLHKISTISSFSSLWFTTVVLAYSSRDELVRKMRYLVMPILLLVYFFLSYFSQDIIISIFGNFLTSNPILFSTILVMSFSLSKPIGGFMFGIAFWRMSQPISYERALEKYLIIAGYGFVLLFSANQSTSLVLTPYPPFGTTTIVILMVASYLIMFGVYTSASLVSKSTELRRTIHKTANELKLLGFIGTAEMEKEINNATIKILNKFETTPDLVEAVDLDKEEIKHYLSQVINQLEKDKSVNS